MKSLLIAALLAATTFPLAAHTSLVCAPQTRMFEILEKHHGQVRIARGLANGATMLVITTNPETGTFSILNSKPDGVTCLLFDGDNFHIVEDLPSPSENELH